MERESKFEVGDRVVVTAGLFKDHDGIIEEIEEGMQFPYKVRVSLTKPSLKTSGKTQCMYYSASYMLHSPRTITVKVYKDLIIAGDTTEGVVVSYDHSSKDTMDEFYSAGVALIKLGGKVKDMERRY